MTLNWKRILILIGFIAGLVLIGYLLYFTFLRPALPGAPAPVNGNVNLPPGVLPSAGVNVNILTNLNVNGGLPTGANINVNLAPAELPVGSVQPTETAAGGLTQTTTLTDHQALKPTLASNGSDAYYYDRTTGLFYQVAPDGKKTPLSNTVFFEVEKVTWAPNKNLAVLEYPDGANIAYNFSNNKQVTLPSQWNDFSFSPKGDKLVFKSMGDTTDNRWLAVANFDGSQAKKIEALGDQDATVYPLWSPNNQMIAMYTQDAGFDQQNLLFIGANNENFNQVPIAGRGFQAAWSPNGNQLLYSVYSSQTNYKPTLWLIDVAGDNIGQNRRSLRLETWANKCSFSGNEAIYCAVPRSLEDGAGIFQNDLDSSPTDIYKIDLKTGLRARIAIPAGNHNIDQVFTTADDDYLYFTDKTSGQLYKINWK